MDLIVGNKVRRLIKIWNLIGVAYLKTLRKYIFISRL